MVAYRSGRTSRARARGFTLIELIVVLLIIAAVAGIVVPAVGMLGRSTDMAATSANQHELYSNIQQFFLLQKRYPQGLDSLLQDTTGGALGSAGDGTADAIYAPLGADTSTSPPTAVTDPNLVNTNNQVSGPGRSGPDFWATFQMVTLNTNQSRSLTRGGFDYVYDHQTYDPATGTGERDSNLSGKYQRTLSTSASVVAALRNPNDATWTDLGTTSNAFIIASTTALLQQLVPSEFNAAGVYTPEVGTRIVAFGVGPRCRLVPTTMAAAPLYPGSDRVYYGRYVAFFKVFDTGERCVLLGVADSFGGTLDIRQRQFNESLPNGGRQP